MFDHPFNDDCGCAPTKEERKGLLSRRGALLGGAFGLAVLGAIATPFAPAAFAANRKYPSWDDVQRAKSNSAAKAEEVARIQQLITQLEGDVAAAEAESKRLGDEFHEAQQEYFAAAVNADTLQSQADEEGKKAKNASDAAGRIAAQKYRNGAEGTTLGLLMAGSAQNADNLLARLGTMDKLAERNGNIYADAVTAQNSAQGLTNLAKVKRDERDRLQKVAEKKMQAAQEAAERAQSVLAAHQERLTTLQAQLAALTDTTNKTISDYQAGVNAERAAREERERKAREQAAANKPPAPPKPPATGGGSSGGGGNSGGGGTTAPPTTPPTTPAPGWVRPNNGPQSSGFGPRTVQCGNSYCSSGYHYGLDLAGSCSSSIVAASAGTVTFVGPNGGYGNFIKIDHGGGIATGYAHIQNGGFRVSRGQWVSAGQLIALVGNTGNSFGCHLHFEVYKNGTPIDPAPFLRARGAL